jgi:hypothetical protein
MRGSAPAAPAAAPVAPERRVVKPAVKSAAAPVNKKPAAPTAAAGVSPANPVAPGGGSSAAAAPNKDSATKVVLVHLPNLSALGSGFISDLQDRLRAAGFDTADKQLTDPKNEPAWRLAPTDMQSAQPGKTGVVVAVYLSGFEEQAERACKVLECTSQPRKVDASDRKVFEQSFQGRHIAVFALNAADAAKPPGK